MPNLTFEGEFTAFEQVLKARFSNVKHVNKGDTILRPGDARNDCYYVLRGVFSYVLKHEHGGEKISSLRGTGTIFPLFYTFPRTNVEGSLEVTALTDAEIIVMPKTELYQLMLEIPDIAITMCDAYGKYSTLLVYEMSNLLFDSSFVRVCNFLLTQALASDNTISMTHEEIGSITGVTRATVTRILNELKKKNVISTSRNSVNVISREKLRSYCSYVVTHDV